MPRVNRKTPLSAAAKRAVQEAREREQHQAFLDWCAHYRVPAPDVEYVIPETGRRFRFDYAWPAHRVALEIDGGVWVGGAHGRGTGITRDQEKTNVAAAAGWRVVRAVPAARNKPELARLVAQVLAWRGEER